MLPTVFSILGQHSLASVSMRVSAFAFLRNVPSLHDSYFDAGLDIPEHIDGLAVEEALVGDAARRAEEQRLRRHRSG